MKNNKEATLKEWGELLDKMGLNDVSTTKINIARILDSDASRLINEEMSKERYNQIIDEVYENFLNTYKSKTFEIILPPLDYIDDNGEIISKEEFINKIKTDAEFSESWGLKIEEREVLKQVDQTNPVLKGSTTLYPHKLITLTYNNETIEVYE